MRVRCTADADKDAHRLFLRFKLDVVSISKVIELNAVDEILTADALKNVLAHNLDLGIGFKGINETL